MPGLWSAGAVTVVLLSTMSFGRVLSAPQTANQTDPAGNPARPEYFTAHVKPLLDTHCGRCHEGTNRRGGLHLDTRSAMLRGGHDGSVLVPGDPDHSLLVRLIRHEGPPDDPMPMPPKEPKLSDADIATITAWVKAGAAMPANLQ